MRKFVLAALCGTVVGAAVSTQLAGPLLAQEKMREASVYQQLDLFGDIFERIRAQYVEEVKPADLIEAAINGMLTSLDPHSRYLPPKDFSDVQTTTRGEFSGLGIEVTQEEGFVKVISPIEGTPADAAGIEAGDFITHVNGESVAGLTLDQAVEMMRGPVGSEVIITVVRKGVDNPFDVSIIRETIKTVAARVRMEGEAVVIRATQFTDQTWPNIETGLKKVVDEAGGWENIGGVILDLRNNPGGKVEAAVAVADAFLEGGEITTLRGRTPQQTERHMATPGDVTGGKPMVVLINSGSASASEIVSGALQDHRRAIIVGTRSFGKGTAQSIIQLRGDGAMQLTTARYYLPSGRSIQALGVAPDIVVQQPPRRPQTEEPADETAAAIRERSEAALRGSLTNDSMTEDEKRLLEEETARAEAAARLREEDYQLAYAVDILRGLGAIAQK
ncbi:S41 family peptidase [Ruixingdingia sedimenti]|uniref:S41 family peptidase n=1 Tax=Ruixingdingia sedimenti TaxID=3073604 RepID=A0ABU1FF21_9RHOB|nr:S41 family peptidase [Xinfangfangia sp. LG-4]MDR5655138.1 S41 family peptidase [Xinfangfangia sp. LG-4]